MLTGVKRQGVYKAMCVIAALGVIVAGYALYSHFASGSSFCNLNAQFNCDVVNRGPYSEIFGIPVAFLGMGAFLFELLLALEQFKDHRRSIKLMLALTLGVSVGFSAHLAWISGELLGTWCLVCIVTYALTAAMAALFVVTEI